MRKADYAALADIIKREREHAKQTLTGFALHEALGACNRIAQAFAARASVDAAAFLKACGMT